MNKVLVNRALMAAMGGMLLVAGCNSGAKKSSGIPVEPKWKGAPYRISFDEQAAKPKTPGIAIPVVKYTANPEALETRVVMVAQFNVPAPAFKDQPSQRMVGAAVDIKGAEGKLPEDYMKQVSKQLSDYLTGYCADGKVNLMVALARSSLNPRGATDGEVEGKRLSDWLPLDLTVKKSGGKCR